MKPALDIPYSRFLRIAFALWWRYWVLWLAVCTALALPLVVAGAVSPMVWEALAASGVNRGFFLMAVLPVFQALLCYPAAVRWFLRSRAAELGVGVAYRGKNAAIASDTNRQGTLFGWSLFFLPLFWDVLNALLVQAIFGGDPDSVRVWASIATIYANGALLHLLAFLPANIHWALGHRFAGVEWTLAIEQPASPPA